MEVKGSGANVLNRRCVFVRWVDLTRERFTDLIDRGTGSLVILMPLDFSMASSDTMKEWRKLEHHLLNSAINIPVYFTMETLQLTKIYEDVHLAAEQDRNSTAAAGTVPSILSVGKVPSILSRVNR